MNTTTSSTIHSKLAKLDVLVKAVNAHPELEKAIEVDDKGNRWLQMCNICNGHVEADATMVELLNKLDEELCGLFISDTGQHSSLFFKASECGYRMRTGERDSWGPLSSIMSHRDINWQVFYG